MRVLLVIEDLSAGGAQRQAITLARGLVSCGVECELACLRGSGSVGGQPEDPSVRFMTADDGRADVVRAFVRLAIHARKYDPDVIAGYLPLGNLAALTARVCNRRSRLVFGIRSTSLHLPDYPLFARLAVGMETRCARFADMHISNSLSGARDAERRGFPRDRLKIVPNGIDGTLFYPDREAGERFRIRAGISAEVPLIVAVGRLHPMKGFDEFVRAAYVIHQLLPDAHFLLAGTGPQEQRSALDGAIRALGLGGIVELRPSVNSLNELYNAANLLCSCSNRSEGFPNVVAEAMACGTPVVATDVGDSRYLVGSAGVVVPPGDTVALAEAAVALLQGSVKLVSGRARVLGEFAVDQLVARTLDAFGVGMA